MLVKLGTYITSLAMLLTASLFVSPSVSAADTPDSAEVAELLSQAKSRALQLRSDAELMEAYSRSHLSWESHAFQIEQIKNHVNKLGEITQKLYGVRETASPWQQEAIDRVHPVLLELAANVSATIEHISQNQSKLGMSTFKDYVRANRDLASESAAIISDFVKYGQTKAKIEGLRKSLKVSHE